MLKIWNKKDLETEGYELINGKIDNIEFSIADHSCLSFSLGISTGSFHIGFGRFCFGTYEKNELADDYRDNFIYTSYHKMPEILMRIMITVGVKNISDLKDTYIRIAYKRGKDLKIIGNILYDVWFDMEDFYRENPEVND